MERHGDINQRIKQQSGTRRGMVISVRKQSSRVGQGGAW